MRKLQRGDRVYINTMNRPVSKDGPLVTDYATIVEPNVLFNASIGQYAHTIKLERNDEIVVVYNDEIELVEPSIDEDSPFWLWFGIGFLTCSFLIGMYEILHNAKVLP